MTVKTARSLVHSCSYESVVLDGDGDDIGEVSLITIPVRSLYDPSIQVKAHFIADCTIVLRSENACKAAAQIYALS